MAVATSRDGDLVGKTRAEQDALARYHAAVARIDGLIQGDSTPHGKTQAEIRARATVRLGRLRRFLAQLGDPHLAYPVIHVGGTSGKGSTSTAVAAILTASGYRTGLHTSPYLQAASEKLQVDGQLIAPDDFADLVDEMFEAHAVWLARDEAPLTYGEMWVAMTCQYFAEARVDIAVIEVGAGGRFDLTNVVQPEVAVITSVGLDHTVTLGPTIPDIAWHKAGIIKPGAAAVTAVTDSAALGPIEAEADKVGTPLIRVIPGETYEIVVATSEGTGWRDLTGGGDELWTALPGRFQAANAATAVAAVRALASRGWTLSDAALATGLLQAKIPGRIETMQHEPRVILDGAHNPDKMAALASALPLFLASSSAPRFVVVLGVLEVKDSANIVRPLLPHATAVVSTSPHVLAKTGRPAADLAEVLRHAGFDGDIYVEPEPRLAFEQALARAGTVAPILVTGSLYLVGNVRGRWYVDDAIVLGRTPWPASPQLAASQPPASLPSLPPLCLRHLPSTGGESPPEGGVALNRGEG